MRCYDRNIGSNGDHRCFALDNDNFLQFAASIPGELGALIEIPPGLSLDVSDEVKRAFLTEEGA